MFYTDVLHKYPGGMAMKDSFNTKTHVKLGDHDYEIFDLNKLSDSEKVKTLPFSLKILLENLLRHEDGDSVSKQDIQQLIDWDPKAPPQTEIAFTPSRVILQDFTGVPAVVDLAAMREAMKQLGEDPSQINPLSPVELVIDHSVMVDHFGSNTAFAQNTTKEFERNQERYTFLRWGQKAFENFKVVPPGTGIVHQVNLEHLGRVVFQRSVNGVTQAFPDTLVGTDSHTTMINGLGVLGWGVGGIEAEAAMLGQAITMLIPQVIGFELTGQLPAGATATDLVLIVVEMLRKKGVVGKFVEFYGDGLQHLPLADRATIANMAPEYGATCGIFPIDDETIKFLKLSGRDDAVCTHVQAYAKAQGLFVDPSIQARYTDRLHLDLSDVEPCIAGPRRPQDRIALKATQATFRSDLSQSLGHSPQSNQATDTAINEGAHILQGDTAIELKGQAAALHHGAVVIAAITSCTNTSNPAVMLAAGLLAKKAHEKGLCSQPWVKTSLAPGSQVVIDYLKNADLLTPLEALRFNLVGFGCTTCIGNSGPLPEKVNQAIDEGNLAVCAVLSGNRNFEGRIHPQVRFAYLASPPLVVAYALAGTMDINFDTMPLGTSSNGDAVYLKDIWPQEHEIQNAIEKSIHPKLFKLRYENVFKGDDQWQELKIPEGQLYDWQHDSTYVKHPPFFENLTKDIPGFQDIIDARVLVKVGDSVTTDHISPAGAIDPKTPAGEYLLSHGVEPRAFNSYGARRGNHEVMMRGTFANIRLRNQLAPGTEGGWTCFGQNKDIMPIFDASMRYQEQHTPLIVIAGKEYGTGSSRDWAAKGTRLLGIKAVIVESFERIHRSNLIGMGVLPLQFLDNQSADSLQLTGHERFTIPLGQLAPGALIPIQVTPDNGPTREFQAKVRIDTPKELEYYQNGGILHYVLRQLAK